MSYTLKELAELMNIHPSNDLFCETFPISEFVYVFRFANKERPLMAYHKMDLTPDFPDGAICLWEGAILDIPEDWYLCDGNNYTPDLRNKFIPGAGNLYAVGATGGNLTHSHTFTGDGHFHDIISGPHIAGGTDYNDFTSTAAITGTTQTKNHLPPYKSYAYIMKNEK